MRSPRLLQVNVSPIYPILRNCFTRKHNDYSLGEVPNPVRASPYFSFPYIHSPTSCHVMSYHFTSSPTIPTHTYHKPPSPFAIPPMTSHQLNAQCSSHKPQVTSSEMIVSARYAPSMHSDASKHYRISDRSFLFILAESLERGDISL